MQTDSSPVTSTRPEPRQPKRWPYARDVHGRLHDGPEAFIVGATVLLVILTIGVIGYHSTVYSAAGARPVQGVGAAAAQLVVLAVLLGSATLYRWGYTLRRVFTVAGVGGVLAVGAALLPHLAAGRGWVATLLGVLFALAVNALQTFYIVMVAVHLPMWWSGWHWD